MPKEAEPQDTYAEIIHAIDQLEVEPDRHISIQIDQSLRDAIHAARTSGKPASVTVTIKVKPEHERRISFAANVAAKLPRPAVSAATLFADDSCRLHRSDPAQLRMFPAPIVLNPNAKKE